ncbi:MULTISPECIES: FxLYD domain-containing protein [unclassified Streptomyces]|uniref:FxLYD domain-containing protein n=1 Tax=unclassified Streptomyces TaxID=2593676 RepID=UPI002365EE4B|nr:MULTISPECIES: FxLYD domain-containing protein [unclassified Streptomyces]MDF3142505.1 FxLYD domain-containing protein [Streptomyces sp. T21Q-yed]WDF39767.1 FxLYD domain-containing protein [Streptomyces sp. T12]
MPGHRTRWTTAAILTATATVAATLTLTSCSDDDTPSSVASKAASAFASATAEAGHRLDDIKGGIDAKDAVSLGDPTTNADGRTTVEVTAENTTDSTKSFGVQINFRDEDGNLLDAAVVTVSDVAAGQTGTGTARSTRDLGGEVKAEVARALRY